ncbi:MAG: glycosyltransferase family 39 protein, partial [candidate division WS1 bacterium]|nr:glycosyltransferase family 39 protein [candidate division WS1 bacterium]
MPYGKVAVILGLIILTAIPYGFAVHDPLFCDEGVFAYTAWASHETGEPPYLAGYDNKTPGIYWLYAVLQAHDQPGVVRVRLVQGAMVLATALILLWWLGEALGLVAGAVAALTWVVAAVCVLWVNFTMPAETEPPMVLFTTLAFFFLYRGLRAFRPTPFLLAGMALGLAFVFKQIALMELLAAAVIVLLAGERLSAPQRRRALGLGVAGFAEVVTLVLIALGVTGQLGEFWRQAFVSPLGGSTHHGQVWEAFRVFLSLNWFLLFAPLGLLAALPWLVSRGETPGAAGEPAETVGEGPLRRLLLIWFLLALAGFLAGGMFYQRQMLTFVPALAGMVGVGAGWLQRRWAGLPGRVVTGRVALVLLLVGLRWGVDYEIGIEAALARRRAGPDPQVQLARALDRYLPAGETLFTPDRPEMYREAKRMAPTRYFNGLTWGDLSVGDPTVADLRRQPPGVIVLERTREREVIRERIRREIVAGRYGS